MGYNKLLNFAGVTGVYGKRDLRGSVSMIIKPLETEDEIFGKAYVHCQAWKEAYAGLIDQDFLDSRTVEMSEQRARKAFETGVLTLVAKDGDRVVGFVDYGPYRGEYLKDTGEVYAIYVLKEFYGKGVGYALMTKALGALSEFRQAAVWVLKGNDRAVQFYERWGYHFDGQEQILTLGTPVTVARMILER